MFHYDYVSEGTCSKLISFDLDGSKVRNITFMGGCDGNLKAIPLVIDGFEADEIISKFAGLKCGRRNTSCVDQLTKAIQACQAGVLTDTHSNIEVDDED